MPEHPFREERVKFSKYVEEVMDHLRYTYSWKAPYSMLQNNPYIFDELYDSFVANTSYVMCASQINTLYH